MDHPRGIEPFGNSLVSDVVSFRDTGLGSLHVLSDALMLEVLDLLKARDLAHLAVTSKSLYCFSAHEDYWKGQVLEAFEGKFIWAGSWKQTYAASHAKAKLGCEGAGSAPLEAEAAKPKPPPAKKKKKGRQVAAFPKKGAQPVLRVKGFYSDLLYQPWFCATVDLAPEWLADDNIDRRSNLSVEDFVEQYERPNRPVVITDVVSKWPAVKKWSVDYLAKAFEGQDIIAGNYDMPFQTYLTYCGDNQDEMPLYLFDKAFCKRAPALAADYSVPPYFRDDLFSLLGEDKRPHYRWLIMGPARSGSSFHVDPNSTSAWNAVVSGCKRWIMYPPHITPPGVHPSPDGADVATPLSIAEWYLNFYAEAKESKVQPVECTVKAGELIFVPRGWWHMAINLEQGVAVTQNFVSRTTLPHVLSFLRPGRSEALVSGCSKDERSLLYDRFMGALQREHPELLEELEGQREAKRRKLEEEHKLSALFKAAPAARASNAECSAGGDAVVAPEASKPAFSFGFSFG